MPAKLDAAAARDRMAAVGLVGAVLADEMKQVLRRRLGDGDQRAEVHQQAAVAVEHDHPLVGPAEREAERMRGREPHRAVREIVERVRPDVDPVERGRIDRQHDVGVGDVARDRREAVFLRSIMSASVRSGERRACCRRRPCRSPAGFCATSASLLDVVVGDAHRLEDRLDDAHAVALGLPRHHADLLFQEADHHADRQLSIRPRRRGWR